MTLAITIANATADLERERAKAAPIDPAAAKAAMAQYEAAVTATRKEQIMESWKAAIISAGIALKQT